MVFKSFSFESSKRDKILVFDTVPGILEIANQSVGSFLSPLLPCSAPYAGDAEAAPLGRHLAGQLAPNRALWSHIAPLAYFPARHAPPFACSAATPPLPVRRAVTSPPDRPGRIDRSQELPPFATKLAPL